jgi:AcrR family transcriptional regulator
MQEKPLGRLHYGERGLPRGRSKLPLPEVQAAQRERLIHAAIGVVAQDGYDKTAVGGIVAAARVSRAAFYAHFADKEACFLAACYHGLELMLVAIGKEVGAAPPEPAEAVLRASIRGFLRFLADEPAFARCFLLEMPAAGAEARRRYLATTRMLAENTQRWHEQFIARRGRGALLDPGAYRILAGGVAHLCTAAVHAGEAASLPALEEPIMATHLAALSGATERCD